MISVDPYRIKPGSKLRLADKPTKEDGGMDKNEARRQIDLLGKQLQDLQELLYAQSKHALLVVLQAMDSGGKDSTIRHVFAPFNPQGVQIVSFKAPNELERKHDFLWRVHQNVPPLGYVGVFNRSHYEDVLIVRVKNLVPESRWRPRYEHINAFEKMLVDEGTMVVKFFLHISKAYQKERLERRLSKPDKLWKFNPADLVERQRWDQYQEAYQEAIRRCSTAYAPWHVIPAEEHWYRNLLISQVLVNTLKGLDLKYPKPDFDPADIVIPD